MDKHIEVTTCETFTNNLNMTSRDQVKRILELCHIVRALLKNGVEGKLNVKITLAVACRIYWINETPCEEDKISSKMQCDFEL